jgi:hypothetical protein
MAHSSRELVHNLRVMFLGRARKLVLLPILLIATSIIQVPEVPRSIRPLFCRKRFNRPSSGGKQACLSHKHPATAPAAGHTQFLTTPPTKTAATADRRFEEYGAAFKRHHRMARPGRESYADYTPAYHYGYTLATEPRYAGRDWSIAFKKKIFWLDALQPRVLDCVCERLERGQVRHMRPFFVHCLPELCEGMIIWRGARPREDHHALARQGKAALPRARGVIPRAILKQPKRLRDLGPYAREQGAVGRRGEPSLLALVPEPSGEGLEHAAPCVACALTRGLDQRLVAPAGPRVCKGPPLGAGGFLTTQELGLPGWGQPQHLGPHRGAPGLPLACIQRCGDERRFWIAHAQGLEPLGKVEDVVEDAQAVADQRLHPGRAPAGAATTRLDRPRVKEGGEFGLLRRGQRGGAAGGLGSRCPVEAIATAPVYPGGNRLLLETYDQCHRRDTLPVADGEESEAIRDLA